MLNLSESLRGNFLVLSIDGRLDIMNYEILEDKLNEIFDEQKIFHLVMECEKLTFISSAGLRLFVMALKKVASNGGKLAVSGLNETNKKIFDLSGYTKAFDLFPDLDSALTATK